MTIIVTYGDKVASIYTTTFGAASEPTCASILCLADGPPPPSHRRHVRRSTTALYDACPRHARWSSAQLLSRGAMSGSRWPGPCRLRTLKSHFIISPWCDTGGFRPTRTTPCGRSAVINHIRDRANLHRRPHRRSSPVATTILVTLVD